VAATPLLTLAEAHRRSQAQLLAALERYIKTSLRVSVRSDRDLQPLVDRWIATVLPTILAYRARSEALARVAYTDSRRIGAPAAAPFELPGSDPIPPDAVAISLRATSLAVLLDDLNRRQLDIVAAVEDASIQAAGAAVRHALNGGRAFMARAVETDPAVVGWYRVTKARPCSFCAVLASRGAVYREDSFEASDPRWIGDGEEKVHDHCACTLAPLYGRAQAIPDASLGYTELWYASLKANEKDVIAGRAREVGQRFSGKDALNSFRRRYEAMYPEVAS
jgi:hypothetical protein